MRLWLLLFLVACGGGDDDSHDHPAADAAPAGDAAPSPDAPPGQVSCSDYCDDIIASCTGELNQWFDRESCLATCELFPPGQLGDETGNSRACRAHHAELAIAEPDPHCFHAGPSGGDVCGTPCEAYCDIVLAVCDVFADDGECMAACAGFPDNVPYSIEEKRGDNVQCRIFHGTRSTTDDAHCGTASPESGPCVDD
jgi:hypothetical protein